VKKSEELQEQYDKQKAEYKAAREGKTPQENILYYDLYGNVIEEHLKRLKAEIAKEQRREVEVGDGVTVCLYTDREAYTVIKRTKYTITIQRDKVIHSPNFKPEFEAGGFCAHCTNQDDQVYDYERDEQGSIEVCHWSEKLGCFVWKGCAKVINGRHEYYDWNF